MERNPQNRAPIAEALKDFQQRRIVPFDVPGHKRGKATRNWWPCWASSA